MEYYKKYEERYQAVYAAGADLWGYTPDNEDLKNIVTDFVTSNKLEGKAVLDLCCGEGSGGVILSELGCKYFGVDVAPSALETAKRQLAPYPDASVALVDLTLDRIPGIFDAAFDSMGFHMLLTDRDRMAYLKNVYEALKPGAPFLLFRQTYLENAYEGPVSSYDQWMEIVGGGYDGAVQKYAKKTTEQGTEKVPVMIPRMPGRGRSEAGYRRELEAAGFTVDNFQVECGWNGVRPFASIWVHK